MKSIVRILASLTAMLLVVPLGLAQSYPSKPVHIVVPYPPGGPTDVLSRLFGQKLSERWSQPVITDNRPGAEGIIGTEAVVKAPADGYTLLFTIDSTLSVNPSLYSKLSYDPMRDLAPITLVGWARSLIVVNGASGPKSLAELIQFARANPGKANFGAGATTVRVAGVLLGRRLGLDIVFVPYKGSAATLQGLFSGDVTFLIVAKSTAEPFIRSGRFRALATTSAQPIASLPGVPTVAEAANLPGFDFSTWMGLFAPAGTPGDIVQRLNKDIAQLLAQPEMRDRLALIGLDAAAANSPAEFAAFIRKETELWSRLLPQAGIQPVD